MSEFSMLGIRAFIIRTHKGGHNTNCTMAAYPGGNWGLSSKWRRIW